MRLKIILVCLLFAIKINAQTELPEVGKIVQVPNSPEASAFVKYGNTQVSLYTGVPNIAIPIYTIKGRELQMPISLSYDASGIKVKQLATNVGLGWNLNVGGVITRSVAGLPDDRITAYPHYKSHHDPSVQSIIDKYPDGMYEMELYDDGDALDFKFSIEQKMNESKVDILPDLYSFNVNGLSDTFYIDYELNIGKCLNNPNLKVNPIFGIPVDGDTYAYNKYIIGFTITDERGSIYEFNKYEVTNKTQGFDGRDKRITFNSAWYLTKIISATKKDILEFTYSDSFTWINNESFYNDYSSLRNPTGSSGISESSYLIESHISFESNCSGISPGAMNTFVRYKISQFNLTNIRLNNKEIVTFQTTANNRLDISGGKKALEYIKIKDLNGSIINEVQLHTTYFETASHPTDYEQYYRLKLDAVSFNSSTDKKYEFKYNGEGNIPSRQSKGQDYWGYYNGKDTNSSLVPKSKRNDISGINLGGNREISSTAVLGTLRELIYPTGGHTAFEYRLNNVEEIRQVENSFDELIVEVTNQNDGFDPNEPFNFLNCSNSIECPGVGNGHTLPEPNGNENSFLIEQSGEYRFQLNTILNGTNADCNYSFFAVFPDTGVQTQYCDVLNNPNALILKTISAADESSLIYTVNLEAGTYKALIFNSIQNATVSVSINRTFTTPITVKRDIGGLRVQKITDYTSFNEIATTKHYYYDDIRELNSSITPNISNIDDSSAIIHEKAIFNEIINYRGFYLQNSLEKHTSCNFDTRYAFNIATAQKNHIAYSKVSEIVFNENDEFQGYKVYDFYNIDYNNDEAFLPYNVEYGNDNNGKLKETTTYNNLGNILTKEESFYNIPEIIDESKTLLSFRSTIAAYRELHVAKINVNGVVKQLYIWQEPANCDNTQICTDFQNNGGPYYDILSLYGGDQTPIYKSKRFGLIRYWNYLEQKKQTNYFYNSANILINTVEQETNYFYENIDHKQLTKTETTTNQNETLITQIDYAHDLLGSQPLMQNLIDANRISEPIQTKAFLNNTSNVLSHQLTKYTLTSDNLLLPQTIQTSNGIEVLEDRIVYHKYDDKGNPLEVSKKDGQSISYIWGYHKSQPIAKIVNATFLDISSYISSLQNLANLDDDRTVDTINGGNITYQGNEGNLREALQNLRTALPNAMVTTFTYDPLIGVTSIVDPKGQIQYFYYDDYNRLKHVKDKHGHILSKNEYNFRPQN